MYLKQIIVSQELHTVTKENTPIPSLSPSSPFIPAHHSVPSLTSRFLLHTHVLSSIIYFLPPHPAISYTRQHIPSLYIFHSLPPHTTVSPSYPNTFPSSTSFSQSFTPPFPPAYHELPPTPASPVKYTPGEIICGSLVGAEAHHGSSRKLTSRFSAAVSVLHQ